MSKTSTSFSSFQSTNTSPGGNSKTIVAVRVLDIILDESHPEYVLFGKEYSIGAIKYAPLDRIVNEEDFRNFPIAYPLDTSTRKFPLKNEIVLLISAPSRNLSIDRTTETVQYYTDVVSIWNASTNPAPALRSTDSEVDLGYDYTESLTGYPLHPFNGDVIVQGRHGQGIRFTGGKSFKNTFTNNQNSSQPLTILTNGYNRTGNQAGFHLEDVNKDLTSVYFASDHVIPLEQSRDKYAGATTRPILAKNYKGNQLVVNSDRLVFNAKSDDILFSSRENFNVTANNVSIDAEVNLGLDGKKIFLGERAVRFELEPIILGNQLELFLDLLLNELLRLSNALIQAKTADQKIIPVLNNEGFVMRAIIKGLQNRINPNGDSQLKSKKVFTE
jgi:hypothetical protein